MEYDSNYFLSKIQNLRLICSVSGCKTIEEIFSEQYEIAGINTISKTQGRDK